MKQNKAALACTVCGSRNYSLDMGTKPRTERLELKSFANIVGNTHYTKKRSNGMLTEGSLVE